MDHPFRNAAFGGFNREDVLKYLENSAQQAAQARQELQQQLEQAGEQARQLQCRVDEQELQLQHLLPLQQELTALREEHAGAVEQLERLQEENHTLRAQVAAMEPSAAAYEQLKERTAGVELEAHRRAQAIQEKAEGDARHLRRQMENWMQRMSREYDALRTEVETTVSHAAVQVDRVGKSLEQITSLLNEREVALESLVQSYADTDPARVTADAVLPAE